MLTLEAELAKLRAQAEQLEAVKQALNEHTWRAQEERGGDDTTLEDVIEGFRRMVLEAVR